MGWAETTDVDESQSPLKATGAHISIVAHITEEEARARLTRTEMANGFANRFLFCCVKRSKLLPHGGALPEAELVDLAQRVKAAADFARQVGRVGMTAEAADAWAAAYAELSAERFGLVGAIIARAEAQVIRLALIFALLDKRTPSRRSTLKRQWQSGLIARRRLFESLEIALAIQ